ncbi:unnamed protein product [Owenia fusiformis]|uniref:Uncharacterized protein n=1 Tax=Owenia fusiformis TaxID=6347 RepID=A0A8J1UMH0_OWEFU|nr:unnamed protein product [Owenia fusiformis]
MCESEKTVIGSLKVKHTVIKGCAITPFFDWQTIRHLENLPIRKDDILVASYPRSGTHWVAELVDIVRNEGNTEALSSLIHSRAHFLELSDKVTNGEINVFEDESDGSRFIELGNKPSPRLLVSHLPADFMPSDITGGHTKVVLVLRNLKSVIVSYHFMLESFGDVFNEPSTIDKVMKSMMRDDGEQTILGTWYNHIKSWLDIREKLKDKLLVIYYEDLVKNMPDAIKSMAAFLGKSFTDDEIAKIAEHLQFKCMKNNAAVGNAFGDLVKTMNRDPEEQVIPHMRKGTIDDWKNHMTVAQSEAVDVYYKDKLETLGLKFQYE